MQLADADFQHIIHILLLPFYTHFFARYDAYNASFAVSGMPAACRRFKVKYMRAAKLAAKL
jgi:hypothetical protein